MSTTQNKVGFTPGPWKVMNETAIPDKLQIVTMDKARGTPDELLAIVRNHLWCNDGEAKANARLIAAAPEMYEACKLGLAAMIAWGGKCEANGEHILARESVIQAEIIRQAIAKATQ